MKLYRSIFLNSRSFYIIGLIVLVYCLGFNWNWMIMLGLILWIILFTAIVWDTILLNRMAGKIEVRRITPKHFSLYDENQVYFEFSNTNRSNIHLRLIDELPVQFQERNFELKVELNKASHRIEYSLQPKERGEYIFRDIHLFLRSGFKLIEFRKTIAAIQKVKVYPSFIQMKLFELMVFNSQRGDLGLKKIRKIGHGYEFSDIRQYVSGDDPRTINWKASSRSQEIMVNNFQDEKSQQIYALINKSRVMRMPFNGLSLMDYAINTSLSIQNIALRNQDHAGVMSFAKDCEEFVPARRRNNQLEMIMDTLYNIAPSTHEADYRNLYETLQNKVRNRSLLLMFTNFMSLNSAQRVLPELQKINRRHLLVVIFFENTELQEFSQNEVKNSMDIASQTMADKLNEELHQIVYELRNAGIQTIHCKPEDLTTQTVNKYLELKSRGLI